MTVGVVTIGRNEGARLTACLQSVRGLVGPIVYVDSGSTDESVEMARAMGVDVVELDMRVPFTAARARNEGYRRLCELAPDIRYVQFVDGDCEIVSTWIGRATAYLDERKDLAVVCGRRRERYPERSIYNMLCDIEWDTPIGEVKACGGDALMRVDAFDSVGGFNANLIAGEEPELCVRLRKKGWRIWRLDVEMTLHDAAIFRFDQWWTRMSRGGYAYAQGAWMHGTPPERHNVRESRSIWFWGLGVPVGVAVLVLFWGKWATLLMLVYPMQVVRLAGRGPRSVRENWWHAAFLVLGKFPEMFGQIKFTKHRLTGSQSRLIEYK